MSQPAECDELRKCLDQLVQIGEQLIAKCEKLKDVNGIGKLLKNCRAELNYLKKLSQKEKFSEAVLKSSNLSNLQGITLCAEHLPDVVGVLRPLQTADSCHPIVVDVVCNGGKTWVKVISKNSKALLANANEQCHFGTRSIKEQARKYLEFARLHPFQFEVPEVTFIFFHDVPPKMEEGLIRLGVSVRRREQVVPKDLSSSGLCCDILAEVKVPRRSNLPTFGEEFEGCDDDDESGEDEEDEDEEEEEEEEEQEEKESDLNDPSFQSLTEFPEKIATAEFLESICRDPGCSCKSHVAGLAGRSPPNAFPLVSRVNLDVTSLIAAVSSLCHGHCLYRFKEGYLSIQAGEERRDPTLPKIYHLLLGKALYSCETAVRDFEKIVSVVGGEEEKWRARRLLEGVTMVPDLPSRKSEKLQESARINPRMRTVFGTGDVLRAVTCSANNGFVRASRQAGVEFVAFVHPARALTEQKEASAERLVGEEGEVSR